MNEAPSGAMTDAISMPSSVDIGSHNVYSEVSS